MVPKLKDKTDIAPNRVLIVEDDPAIRLVLAEAMREAAFRVIEARSGEDAVNYLKAGEHVDLIFSDIQMPGAIDGLQLAHHVRAAYPAIPVILTSGDIKPAGLGDTETFIAKPYKIDKVLALVAQILQGPHAS
jgi:CheY-like chemotaxis protein